MEMVEKKLQKPILFFEHGDVGQTVKHAHIHAIPFDESIDTGIAQMGIEGKTEKISNLSDTAKYSQYLLFMKAGELVVFLPDSGVAIPPAPITNGLARYFGKPTPAVNRPSPSAEEVSSVQKLFSESSHGS